MGDTYNEDILPEDDQAIDTADEELLEEDTGAKGGATERSRGDLDEMDPYSEMEDVEESPFGEYGQEDDM